MTKEEYEKQFGEDPEVLNWLEEKGFCFWCAGTGNYFFHKSVVRCEECLGSGKQSDAERVAKVKAFK